MKYLLFIYLAFTALSATAQKRNVLIVGNSISFYNDMPVTLQHLCDDNNTNINVEQSTFPGVVLKQHLRYKQDTSTFVWKVTKTGEVSPTMAKILSKKWDIVFFQEGPGRWLIPEFVQYEVLPTLNKFDSILSIQHTKMLIMEPYTTSQSYPVKNCWPAAVLDYYTFIERDSVCSPYFPDDNSEYEYIDSVIHDAGRKLDKDFVMVGKAFKLWHDKYPEIVLYADDHGHPDKSGSYLITLLYYRAITGTYPANLTYTNGIHEETAKKLKEVAMEVTD